MNLMTAANGNYKFLYFDIGGRGSESDASVFAECELGRATQAKKLHFQQNMDVGGTSIPFFLVFDITFPLCEHLIKP